MNMKKLAVVFPGIGYHKDKPLLYYAAKLAQNNGYEIMQIAYRDMPQKIRGNAEMMRTAAALAFQQTEEQLSAVKWSDCGDILLIGKSIGTIAAAKYAVEHQLAAKQIWYTPLNATFSFAPSPAGSCIAFLGTADPWSDVQQLRQDAEKSQIPLYLYPECNHSLESGNIIQDIEALQKIMQITSDFISR